MTIALTRTYATFKAIEALKAGKLGAQNLESAQIVRCHYRYDNGCCCVIGAGLSDDEAKTLDNYGDTSISSLISDGHVFVNDWVWFKEIQQAHDECCHAIGMFFSPRLRQSQKFYLERALERWDYMIELLGLNPNDHPFPHDLQISVVNIAA